MEITKILTADVLDILFEGKNKEYGAYELRKSYNKRLTLSLAVMFLVILLLWGGYLLAGTKKVVTTEVIIPPDLELKKYEEPKKMEPIPLPPTPPAPHVVVPMQQSIAFTSPPRIVNEDVAENEKPPTQDEMTDLKIGTVNNPNGDVSDVIAPPDGTGTDKGIIAAPPAPRDEDEIVLHVQIESQYPGGPEAWKRFLRKTLGNYPQEALDQQIQGTVVIQFIVDREGNVSDIEAISGPKELRDAAIRAVKKSGKWVPAEQNGRKVKSYKRQPFLFQLPEE
jgi:protein TonB